MAEQLNISTPVSENAEDSPRAATSATCDFANLEDKGRWLTFRVMRAEGSIPVRITREAMEDHFGASKGEKSLAEAYLKHSDAINATALALAPSGDVYSAEHPLQLSAGDFE